MDTLTVAVSGVLSSAVAVGLTWAMMRLTLSRIAVRVRQDRPTRNRNK